MPRTAQRLPTHTAPEDCQARRGCEPHDEHRSQQDRPLEREVGDPHSHEHESRDCTGGGGDPDAHEHNLARRYARLVTEANYVSGDDYVVEFLGYRFGFNCSDFEQRVTAAAVKLGLVRDNQLGDDATADLVPLLGRAWVHQPPRRLGREPRRRRSGVVVCAAPLARARAPILWAVYSYRLHNLPTFVPPAHGLVFMAGLSLSEALRRHARALVAFAAAAVTGWGVLGLTVLPRLDAAGALCIPLLLAFLWRSQARAAYAGVFLVVAALELYGTAIGTWRWAAELPGLGIPDGNPPSGVAAGYVWFDVMAPLFAPRLLAAVQRTWQLRHPPAAGTWR